MAEKNEKLKRVMAKAKSIRTSGQKLNLVAQSIRGQKIKQAIDQLTFSWKKLTDQLPA